MTSRDHIKKVLASAVSGYIAATEWTDVQLADICEALSRLTQEFLTDNPSWDSRSTWLDGIIPSLMNAMRPMARSSCNEPPPKVVADTLG